MTPTDSRTKTEDMTDVPSTTPTVTDASAWPGRRSSISEGLDADLGVCRRVHDLARHVGGCHSAPRAGCRSRREPRRPRVDRNAYNLAFACLLLTGAARGDHFGRGVCSTAGSSSSPWHQWRRSHPRRGHSSSRAPSRAPRETVDGLRVSSPFEPPRTTTTRAPNRRSVRRRLQMAATRTMRQSRVAVLRS